MTEHAITDDGAVEGQFTCRGPKCGFEGTLALDGWVAGEDQPEPPEPH